MLKYEKDMQLVIHNVYLYNVRIKINLHNFANSKHSVYFVKIYCNETLYSFVHKRQDSNYSEQ